MMIKHMTGMTQVCDVNAVSIISRLTVSRKTENRQNNRSQSLIIANMASLSKVLESMKKSQVLSIIPGRSEKRFMMHSYFWLHCRLAGRLPLTRRRAEGAFLVHGFRTQWKM